MAPSLPIPQPEASMTTHLSLTIAALVMAAPVAVEGPQKPAKHATYERTTTRPDAVHAQLVFSAHDRTAIREYYAPRFGKLPPGLRKKIARGGELPPGWEKKIEYFPPVLESRLVVLPAGYRRGMIDAHAVIYKAGSPVIIDATVLF